MQLFGTTGCPLIYLLQGSIEMEHAKCTEDGVIYAATNFSRLSPEELGRKRQLLQCPECFVRAFFRHASFNGRAACFGARPHADGCSLAAQDQDRLEEGDDFDVQHIPTGKIVVDFSYGTHEPSNGNSSHGQVLTFDSAALNYDRTDAQASRRLRSLLRMLIKFPAFRDSNILIEIYPYGKIAVRDFFVTLDSVTKLNVGMFRGFWGVITDAQSTTDGSLWLNSGGRDSISFCIDYKFVDLIAKRYRLRNLEDLAGAYILAFGVPHVSTNGKLHVILQEPEYIFLKLVKA